MKFSELNFDFVKQYLVITDEDRLEIEVYISAAKSYVKKYTRLTDEELDENEYIVMPTLMLVSSFYENKSTETTNKINFVFTNLLNLGKDYDLWLVK